MSANQRCLHKVGDEVITPMELAADGPDERGIIVEVITIPVGSSFEYDCIVEITLTNGSKFRVRYFDTSLTPCKRPN